MLQEALIKEKKVLIPQPKLLPRIVGAFDTCSACIPGRTFPEKIGVLSFVGFATYKVFKWGVPQKICSLIMGQVPGWGALKLAMGIKPKVTLDSSSVLVNSRTVLESVRPGSIETSLPMPKYQALVGQLVDGDFKAHGSTVRMGNFLVMPGHVFSFSEQVVVFNKGNYLDITGLPYEDIETDLVAVQLAEHQFSKLLLSMPTICHEFPDQGHYASIVGPVGKGTTGVLKTDNSVFGRVVYNGSTLAGYSGSPYVVGTSIAGIHQSGGAVNGGFSASYVWTLLKVLMKERDEGSEDWLRATFQRGRKIRIDSKWGSPDEIRIQIGGRYSIVQKDSMNKAFGSDWSSKMSSIYELDSNWRQRGYDESISREGEANSSKTPGASNGLAKSQDSTEASVIRLTNKLSRLSNSKTKRLLTLLTALEDNTDSPKEVQQN